MQSHMFWLGGALCVIGFFLPAVGPFNALGSGCSIVGLVLVVYSLFGARSKTKSTTEGNSSAEK